MTSRKTVMRLLALAPAPLLESALQKDLPALRARGCKLIRKPETGLIMARGRISGTGSPFNVGEVLVTRCAVSLTGGQTGYAWILGADSDHARDAALAGPRVRSLPREGASAGHAESCGGKARCPRETCRRHACELLYDGER